MRTDQHILIVAHICSYLGCVVLFLSLSSSLFFNTFQLLSSFLLPSLSLLLLTSSLVLFCLSSLNYFFISFFSFSLLFLCSPLVSFLVFHPLLLFFLLVLFPSSLHTDVWNKLLYSFLAAVCAFVLPPLSLSSHSSSSSSSVDGGRLEALAAQ